MRIGRNVRVIGRVQGVFFRAWAKQQAEEIGVAGWIRNAPDGSVEGHLSGDEKAVLELIKRLREGPPSALVRRVHVEEAGPEPADGFEVRQ